VQPLGFFRETAETCGGFGAGELTNGVNALFVVGIKVEPLFKPPCMARNSVGAVQIYIVLGSRSGGFEYIVDDRPHRKNSGACINHRAAHANLPDLTARATFLFQYGDRHPS